MDTHIAEEKQTETAYVWQPVMLIVPERVECDCGAKAIFIVLDDHETNEGGNEYGYVAWCRDCWEKEQG